MWNYKPDKIKRKTLIRPTHKGGLNMVDFNMVEKSLKASLVKRLASNSNSNWKATFLEATKSIGGSLVFYCNYDVKKLPKLPLSQFYKDVLNIWQEIHSHDEPKNAQEIKKELIWNNQFITIDKISFFL